jgi:hypothetical protein
MILKIREIRREQAVNRFQRDSLVVQTAKEIQLERMEAFTGHDYFEGGCDGGE